MSGGSFNYLFTQDGLHLLTDSTAEDNLEAMGKQLVSYGQAGQLAAARTQALLLKVQAYRATLSKMVEEIDAGVLDMSTVWKSAEWHASGDSGKADVLRVLAQHDQACHSEEHRVNTAVELALADAIDDISTPLEETSKHWQFVPELSPTTERRVQRQVFHTSMSQREREKTIDQFHLALDRVLYFASGRVKDTDFLLSIL